MGPSDKFTRRMQVLRSFSPSAPITNRTLFAGRIEQMNTLISVAYQRGQHAVIYGERGVGKTSLAKVMKEVLDSGSWASYHTCASNDTFGSIWRSILRTCRMSDKKMAVGFTGSPRFHKGSLEDLLPSGDEPSPNDVRLALEVLADGLPESVIFIDEFDRPSDPMVSSLFADTIKILSDQSVAVTVVLVGVADTIDELIAEHASVQRALVQIQMPRMTNQELLEIIRQGMKSASLRVQSKFAARVVELSQGLPHYTHLLSQHAALHVLAEDRVMVANGDFEVAVSNSLTNVSQTVREKYHRSTFSNRENLYQEVLLACALAEKDEMGTFGAPDVRDQLSLVAGKRYEIQAFANHLTNFSAADGPRGGILLKRGTQRRFRYRFIDPLLPPYVLMKGTSEGRIRIPERPS
ncbi:MULTISPECIES: ATP-binding protein [Streptacidiphilus]|uniref:ATP-binding protein n=1 Tax=Streptacidiphilus cavernicola TaxID=3342716 RepID=A0ABV6UGS4_9ACTN|nr:ATP-binding protein [Streptacidiphilus jeojiense]